MDKNNLPPSPYTYIASVWGGGMFKSATSKVTEDHTIVVIVSVPCIEGLYCTIPRVPECPFVQIRLPPPPLPQAGPLPLDQGGGNTRLCVRGRGEHIRTTGE
jgi:hypothetical protein